MKSRYIFSCAFPIFCALSVASFAAPLAEEEEEEVQSPLTFLSYTDEEEEGNELIPVEDLGSLLADCDCQGDDEETKKTFLAHLSEEEDTEEESALLSINEEDEDDAETKILYSCCNNTKDEDDEGGDEDLKALA